MATPRFEKNNRPAFLNFLRAKYEAYTGQVTVQSRPYYLCVDPCDVCQLRCPTCPTGVENESKRTGAGGQTIYRRQRAIMTAELFDALLDELGEYLFLIMFYNWGEPLLNRSLPSFIRKAKDQNIETEIHTNLSLRLSDRQIDELLSSGLDYLNASVDGFSQELYQIHRVGGDLDLVKENLERLARARDRLGAGTRISYKFLVFGFNEHEVPQARQYCENLGINFIHGDAFIHDPTWLPSHRKTEKPYYLASDVQAMLAKAEAAGAEGYFFKHEKQSYWFPFPRSGESEFPSFCSWHYGVSVVTAGGPVAPCCATAKERDDFGTVVPGAIRFGDVWNNQFYRASRAAFSGKETAESGVNPLCARCHFPKFVHHLYNVHDAKVITQFYRVLAGRDPVLEEGFDLLAKLPSERDAVEFTKFFEQHLLSHT